MNIFDNTVNKLGGSPEFTKPNTPANTDVFGIYGKHGYTQDYTGTTNQDIINQLYANAKKNMIAMGKAEWTPNE